MKNIRSTLILLLLLIIISCKKKVQETTFEDRPILQSYMSPGEILTLNVSRQIPFISDATFSPDDINNLDITLNYGSISHKLKTLNNGTYVDSNAVVSLGTTYSVSFQYNSKQVSAYTIVPSKPTGYTQSDTVMAITQKTTTSSYGGGGGSFSQLPITLKWDNPDGSNYTIIVENMEVNPILINTTQAAPTSKRFRIKPTTTNTYDLRSREFSYYGKTRLILYHLNADYAALYDNTANSSQNLTNPSTSIVNGFGIFTATNSDTLYVHIKMP